MIKYYSADKIHDEQYGMTRICLASEVDTEMGNLERKNELLIQTIENSNAEIAQRDGYIKTLSDLAVEHNNEIARLREALRFYAKGHDGGTIAREALERKSP